MDDTMDSVRKEATEKRSIRQVEREVGERKRGERREEGKEWKTRPVFFGVDT